MKHRSGGRGLQKSMTDVPLEHHEECACVCKDDSDWPQTCVTAASGSTRDVRNEALPLFLSHPLLLEANKIPLLSCCPFTNWMKQNRLESNKSSKWIWLLWNTNRVLWVHFTEAKKKKITGADLDHYLWALKTIFFHSSEIRTLGHLCLFFLRSFFTVQSVWADTVMKNGSFFVQVLFYVYKWAGSSRTHSLGSSIITIKAKKGGFLGAVFFCSPSCFNTDLICGNVQPQYSLKCITNALCVNIFCSVSFLY